MFPLWQYQVIVDFFKISFPREFLGVGRKEEEKKKTQPGSLIATNHQGQLVFACFRIKPEY